MFLFGPPNVEKLKAKRDIQGLLKALGFEKDYAVQRAAENALTEIGTPAVQPLINLLKAKRNDRQRNQTTSLLTDKRHDLRDHAIRILGKIGDARAVPPLITLLEEHWICAPEALARIGRPEGIEALLVFLRDHSSIVGKRNVVEALSLANAPQIVEPLSAILIQTLAQPYSGDPDRMGYEDNTERERRDKNKAKQEFSRNLVLALSKYKQGQAIWAINLATDDEASAVRQVAVEALEKIKGMPGPASDLESLVTFLDSADGKIRARALEMIIEFGDERQIDSIANHLASRLAGDNGSARLAAAQALAQLGRAPANQREAAYLAIARGEYLQAAEFGGAAVEPLLDSVRESQSHTSEKKRNKPWPEVIQSLVKIGTPAIEPLVAALQESDDGIRLVCVRALGDLKDTHAIEPLSQALYDRDSKVREAAVQPLASLAGPAVKAKLVQVGKEWLDRGDDAMARQIEKALIGLGDKKGAQILMEALHRADIQREMARERAEIQNDVVVLEDGLAAMEARSYNEDRGLKQKVNEMVTVLKSSARAKRLPANLLKKLETIKDGEDFEVDGVSTDPHDSYFAVETYASVHIDCSDIRRLASQELERRK